MKTVIILISLTSVLFAFGSQFCNGFKAGYKEGYCYQKYACMAPLTPLCPLPQLGRNNWKGGYNQGFLEGLANR